MIAYLSLRYSFSRTAHHRMRALRIALATALSLAVLMVTVSVMDHLQQGRFERIRDVSSFDIVLDGDVADDMRARYPGASVFVYGEGSAVGDGSVYRIRYIGPDYDGGLELEGSLEGIAASYSAFARSDGTMTIASMQRGRSGAMLPKSVEYPLTGAFHTALGRSFDSSTLFMSIDSSDGSVPLYTAIKGVDGDDIEFLRKEGYSGRSWKESEAGLYSAFAAERIMMHVVLSLLFLIIIVSTKQSVKSFFSARVGERAELIVLGLGRRRAGAVFMLSFLIIISSGIVLGLMLSWLFIPLGELFVRNLTGTGADLTIPYRSFIFFSLALLSITALLAIAEERRMDRIDAAKVLANEESS